MLGSNSSQNGNITASRRQDSSWERDGVNGGQSSMEIIVDWLRKPENYRRWEDSYENYEETKETLCSHIRNLLVQNGIHHITNKDIRNRIKYIHEKLRECKDWLSQTGQSIMEKAEIEGTPEEEVMTSIKDIVKSKFKYYYEFEPMLGDWPHAIFPNSSLDTLDAENLFFGNNNNYDSEGQVSDDDESEGEASSSAAMPSFSGRKRSRRLMSDSASLPDVYQRPSNRALSGIEIMLAESLKKKHEVDLARLEIEKSRVEFERPRAQALMTHAWKSLGLSDEEVAAKISEMWHWTMLIFVV